MSPVLTQATRQWRGIIDEYRDRLPVTEATPVISLREGGTPLVRANVVSERTGCDVWLKVEGANPTGSFKDRGMTMAISRAAEEGAQAVICASTGNTSASAAAYAVRAGMVCAVLVPQGKIALGKLSQALAHGARLLQATMTTLSTPFLKRVSSCWTMRTGGGSGGGSRIRLRAETRRSFSKIEGSPCNFAHEFDCVRQSGSRG